MERRIYVEFINGHSYEFDNIKSMVNTLMDVCFDSSVADWKLFDLQKFFKVIEEETDVFLILDNSRENTVVYTKGIGYTWLD